MTTFQDIKAVINNPWGLDKDALEESGIDREIREYGQDYLDQKGEKIKYYIHNKNETLDLMQGSLSVINPLDEWKNFIISKFNEIDKYIALDFEIVSSSNEADITIYCCTNLNKYGHVNYPNVPDWLIKNPGNSIEIYWQPVFLDPPVAGISSLNSFDAYTIIHEIGHALSLCHPNSDGEAKEFNQNTTIMSYNIAYDTQAQELPAPTWRDIDIKALQYIWGSEDNFSTNIINNKVANYNRSVHSVKHNDAFAILKSDGSVITWGDASGGGDSSSVSNELNSGVIQIYSNSASFAALKNDGSVVLWGGYQPHVFSNVAPYLTDIVNIFSTSTSFAALKNDGSVITWGQPELDPLTRSQLSKGVTNIFTNDYSFAALKNDGSVITWGESGKGGDSSSVRLDLSSGVKNIVSTIYDFAALKEDGSVVAWGLPEFAGDTSKVQSKISSGVKEIYASEFAFAALKEDGSVITWGNHWTGGGEPKSNSLNNGPDVSHKLTSNVIDIVGNFLGFAALKSDGSVVTWGALSTKWVEPQLSSGIKSIYTNDSAFAAVKDDGSVVTWGGTYYTTTQTGANSSLVSSELSSGVVDIFSTENAFAALKSDGSVVTWGDKEFGGDSSSVNDKLQNGVVNIFSTNSSFAALKTDGSIVSWGGEGWIWNDTKNTGGDSSLVSSHLKSNVVGYANPFTDDWLGAAFNGTNNADILQGMPGNDLINGKAGIDTVLYTSNFKDYSFSRNNRSLQIADTRQGLNDGIDTLKDIEYIQFLDQTVDESKVDITKIYNRKFSEYKFYNKGNGVYQIKTDSGYDDITGIPKLTFSDQPTGISAIADIKGTFDQVTGLNTDSGEMFRLYNAAFARFPDADGLKYWIDQFSSGRNTRRVVAQSFLGSAEFTEKYGSNVSDETYVNNLYKNVLGRDADTEGLNYWVGNLSSGLETRYEALLGFAESAENKALFTDMTGFG